MLVLRIFFSDQNEKENTEVKEKSIDKFYKNRYPMGTCVCCSGIGICCRRLFF